MSHIRITEREYLTLVECADTCDAIGGELSHEASEAQKSIKAINKRNSIKLTERQDVNITIDDAYESTN